MVDPCLPLPTSHPIAQPSTHTTSPAALRTASCLPLLQPSGRQIRRYDVLQAVAALAQRWRAMQVRREARRRVYAKALDETLHSGEQEALGACLKALDEAESMEVGGRAVGGRRAGGRCCCRCCWRGIAALCVLVGKQAVCNGVAPLSVL